MARARWRALHCCALCVALSLGLGGCRQLFTSEGTPAAARARVRFVLQTIKDYGSTMATQLQTAICRWDSDKIFISDRERLAAALDAFDIWRQQAHIYPTLQGFTVDDKVGDRQGSDPPNTYYVAVTIDGVAHRLRVPPNARLSWVDDNVIAAGALTAGQEKKVAPIPEAELRRKRAEWEEHLRMTEQAQADLQAWRRSRKTPAEQAPPRVTATQPAGDEGTAAMKAWYSRYRSRTSSVSLALSQLKMAAEGYSPDQARVLAACRDLRAASQTLVADPEALAAPLETVSGPLTTAYAEIAAAATSCLDSRSDQQAAHLAAARQAMAQAAAALRPYRMTP